MRIASISVTIAILSVIAAGPASASERCVDVGSWTSTCSISNSGTQVDLTGNSGGGGNSGGNQQTPGAGRGDTLPKHINRSDGQGQGPAPLPAPAPTPTCSPVVGCRGNYDVVVIPDPTLADIASFVPARPVMSAEPKGIGIIGMPMNVVASASEQYLTGTLFDYDVTVRFIPTSFRFDYGDGTVRTSTTGGASWGRLGQAEFTPTATSHVYSSRGTYTVSVTVLYSASVDFGSGNWRDVPGFVEATLGGNSVRIVEVHTALVDKTCTENPNGPGC